MVSLVLTNDGGAGWRPSPGEDQAAPLGGIRTRVDDVTGRHPRPLNDQGVGSPEVNLAV